LPVRAIRALAESVVEEAAAEWLEAIGYAVLGGPETGFGEPGAQRSDPGCCDVLLDRPLHQALLTRLNPDLPLEACSSARQILESVRPLDHSAGVHELL
jgi:type I restriction enzyme, R subunit